MHGDHFPSRIGELDSTADNDTLLLSGTGGAAERRYDLVVLILLSFPPNMQSDFPFGIALQVVKSPKVWARLLSTCDSIGVCSSDASLGPSPLRVHVDSRWRYKYRIAKKTFVRWILSDKVILKVYYLSVVLAQTVRVSHSPHELSRSLR